MRRWVLVPAGLAPVALIGGWSLAGALQPPGYDPLRDTISALAASGAVDASIMTTGLAVLGVCHMVTASGLSGFGTAARLVLAVGGAATVAVASLPQPNAGHVPAATVGFVALALWPAASAVPRRRGGGAATAVVLVLLAWFAVELGTGSLLGLSERALAGAETLCPLALVLGRLSVDRTAA